MSHIFIDAEAHRLERLSPSGEIALKFVVVSGQLVVGNVRSHVQLAFAWLRIQDPSIGFPPDSEQLAHLIKEYEVESAGNMLRDGEVVFIPQPDLGLCTPDLSIQADITRELRIAHQHYAVS